MIRPDVVRWGVPVYGIEGPNERCIELPLGIESAKLEDPGWVLDAGCALAPAMRTVPSQVTVRARIVHLTESIGSEECQSRGQLASYVSADLRDLSIFTDRAFDRVICLSTLEHVGLDNRQYGGTNDHCPETARMALLELWRVTKETLLLSVPVTSGPEWKNWKWRYFTEESLADLLSGFPTEVQFYTRGKSGWQGGLRAMSQSPVEGGERVTHIAVVKVIR